MARLPTPVPAVLRSARGQVSIDRCHTADRPALHPSRVMPCSNLLDPRLTRAQCRRRTLAREAARQMVRGHEARYYEAEQRVLAAVMLLDDGPLLVAQIGKAQRISGMCEAMMKAKARGQMPSPAQCAAVAGFLIDNFGSARRVLAGMYGILESTLFPEDEYLQGIPLHPTLDIGFGRIAVFAADEAKQSQGVTYTASREAISAVHRGCRDSALVAVFPDGPDSTPIVVLASQAQAQGWPRAPHNYYSEPVEAVSCGDENLARSLARLESALRAHHHQGIRP
jgi:hypothetical protein